MCKAGWSHPGVPGWEVTLVDGRQKAVGVRGIADSGAAGGPTQMRCLVEPCHTEVAVQTEDR